MSNESPIVKATNSISPFPAGTQTQSQSKWEVYNEEIVRNEVFLALDYYVTESSGHNSEYNAWFRKRPDLIKKYCIPRYGLEPWG